MARFGTEGLAYGSTANVASIGADFGRIVARFQDKGKPDPAWKSRLFNNLDCTQRKNSILARRPRCACQFGRRPCGRPQGYDSRSPSRDFRPFERIQSQIIHTPLENAQERPS
jgi:hypothetical protein